MDTSEFDVIIAGGGPAGMSAALWCADLGLNACLIDCRSDLGGQLHWIHNPIENYIGAKFADGTECLHRFKASLPDRRIELRTDEEIDRIELESGSVVVHAGEKLAARAFVLATGVRRRTLGVPGEEEFKRKGILGSGSRDRRQAADLRVAVIGGGDAALENALILAEHAEKVYLIHRREEFSARPGFVEAVDRHQKIEIIFSARVKELGGSEHLEFLDLEDPEKGIHRLLIDKAVIRIGFEPNSELLNMAEIDDAGYLVVDAVGRTSLKRVYAIGDVAHPTSPTIATAVGSAATAVKTIASEIQRSE